LLSNASGGADLKVSVSSFQEEVVGSVRTMTEAINASFAEPEFNTVLLGALAGLGPFLSALAFMAFGLTGRHSIHLTLRFAWLCEQNREP
jgi:hypothetical protein